jgi:hypothetical protein
MDYDTPQGPDKIMFLDIDGVLNSRRTCIAFDGFPHSFSDSDLVKFDWVAVGLISNLCRETGCKIVLSSTWRYDYTAEQCAEAFDLPIIDITPNLMRGRGWEIAEWLEDHPEVTTYAIVDDIADMRPSQQQNFVQTDEMLGLTVVDWRKLKNILEFDYENSDF